jgi:KipI family sensor histidine kinase inhibitor
MRLRIHPLRRAVSLVIVEAPSLGELEHARASAHLARALGAELGEGRVVAGGTSVLVEDTETDALAAVLERVRAEARDEQHVEAREHAIDVVYDGADLESAADRLGLAAPELVARHARRRYEVLVSGFLPGFAYLGPVDPSLELPRLPTPRRRVPAGSVALAGPLTGIYPFASPGGWNLIGRAIGVRLFEASREPTRLLRIGDFVRFVPREAWYAPIESSAVPPVARRAEPGLRVLRAAPATTIQDLGRPLRRGEGLPSGGALDRSTLRAANLAVGNLDSAAALEIPQGSLELEALSELTLSIDGAAPQRVQRGDRVLVPALRRAVRYLAVRGGIDVPLVLGSAATLLVAGLGGLEGRALQAGDELTVGDAADAAPPSGTAAELGPSIAPLELWARAWAPDARLPDEAIEWLFAGAWRVGARDRIGTRLVGPPIPRQGGDRALPEPVLPGAIQVSGDGSLVVLGPDAAVTGGYPVVALLEERSLDALARAPAGAELRFSPAR